jgi:hypothetical protein
MDGCFYFNQGNYLFRSDIELPFNPASLLPAELKVAESAIDFNILEIPADAQLPESTSIIFNHDLAQLTIQENSALVRFNPTATPQDKQLFVYRFVIPTLLKQHGLIILHASATASDGKVTLVVGPSSSGKSLYTANKVKEGAQLYADDLLFLEYQKGEVYASGGQSLFHLDEPCRKQLNIKKADTLPVYGSEKRSLKAEVLGGKQTAQKLPVTRVIILDSTKQPVTAQLSKVDVLKQLLDSEYQMPWFEEDVSGNEGKLRMFSHLTIINRNNQTR